jgi:hypothetical protein
VPPQPDAAGSGTGDDARGWLSPSRMGRGTRQCLLPLEPHDLSLCGRTAAVRALLGPAASGARFLGRLRLPRIPFGCPTCPLELGPSKQKWDAQARPGKLVGCDANGQLYSVVLADERTVKITKHVRFRERAAGSAQLLDPVTARTSAAPARRTFYLCDDISCRLSPVPPAAGVNPSCSAPDVPALPVELPTEKTALSRM